jgi:hypothetical protein
VSSNVFQANQGYWLLLDAFIFIFTDSKLQEHKQRMMMQVVGILIPVSAF